MRYKGQIHTFFKLALIRLRKSLKIHKIINNVKLIMAHKFISRSKKRDSHLCAIHPLISSSYLTAHHHHHHLSWHIYSLTLSRVYYTHLLYCEREWGRKKTFLATSTSELFEWKKKREILYEERKGRKKFPSQ